MSLRWSSPICVYESLSWMTIVEPLSALFMMIVLWMISFSGLVFMCMLGCLWVSVTFVMFCLLPL